MKLNTDWLRDPVTQKLMACFRDNGAAIYFVGGCVRNAILGAPTADLDLATDAIPDQTITIAQSAGFKTVPTGKDHGTITVLGDGGHYEVTSFRKDVETRGRRAVVAFSKDILDDAARRDFTMNALYADAEGVVIDPLNGLQDTLDRRVRFINDPVARIEEDYLRILRFFRFHAWYGDPVAGMDADALAAIASQLDGLDQISKERIGAEVKKLLAAPDPVVAVCAMEAAGVLGKVLSGCSSRQIGPLVHLETELGLPIDWLRRLLALGGTNLKQDLRLSNADASRLNAFASAAKLGAGAGETAYRFGAEVALDLALITSATLGTIPDKTLLPTIARGAAAHFPVSATDIHQDFTGAALGAELRRLLDIWIASDFVLRKDELLSK
jgi:poly(A) polymerase